MGVAKKYPDNVFISFFISFLPSSHPFSFLSYFSSFLQKNGIPTFFCHQLWMSQAANDKIFTGLLDLAPFSDYVATPTQGYSHWLYLDKWAAGLSGHVDWQ